MLSASAGVRRHQLLTLLAEDFAESKTQRRAARPHHAPSHALHPHEPHADEQHAPSSAVHPQTDDVGVLPQSRILQSDILQALSQRTVGYLPDIPGGGGGGGGDGGGGGEGGGSAAAAPGAQQAERVLGTYIYIIDIHIDVDVDR